MCCTLLTKVKIPSARVRVTTQRERARDSERQHACRISFQFKYLFIYHKLHENSNKKKGSRQAQQEVARGGK